MIDPTVISPRRKGAAPFSFGGNADPKPLKANADKSFNGSKVYGQGFVFSDDGDLTTTPVEEMRELLKRNPAYRAVIFPYVGGEDINTDARQESRRFVINFRAMSLEAAQQWPDALSIVENKVKPDREELGGYSVADGRRERWWQYGTYAAGAERAIASLSRCLVMSQVSARHSLAFQPVNQVFSHAVIIVALSEYAAFCVLQCQGHEAWARFFGSSLEDRLRYTPSVCFETFAFPPNWRTDLTLEATGHSYYTFRATLMVRNDEGLTKTYNRFHDPDERSPDILRLRDLHAAMDRAVLDAYGWTDISTDCDFFLDYEIDEETWGDKKKPYRYRWPDAVRDEVLARLLDLNQKRHQEDVAAGLHGKLDKAAPGSSTKPKAPRKPKKPRTKSTAPLAAGTMALFDPDEEDR